MIEDFINDRMRDMALRSQEDNDLEPEFKHGMLWSGSGEHVQRPVKRMKFDPDTHQQHKREYQAEHEQKYNAANINWVLDVKRQQSYGRDVVPGQHLTHIG